MKCNIVFVFLVFIAGCGHSSKKNMEDSLITLNLLFGHTTSVSADAIVNSGNTRFEFFGGGAKHLSNSVGLINGLTLPNYLRAKHGTMEEGLALLSAKLGKLSGQYKFIIHVSAVHTAGNPKKSLIPRSLHNEHPLIMGSFLSVKNSIKNALLIANKNGISSLNLPPLATSRGISKKVSIEALKLAIEEYYQIVGNSNQISILNYIVYLKNSKKDPSEKYNVSDKKVWEDTWSYYFGNHK